MWQKHDLCQSKYPSYYLFHYIQYNCISSFWFQELNLVLHFFLLNAKKRCNWASVSGFWSCCGTSACPAMPKPFLRVTVKVESHCGFWVQRHWLEYFWSSCAFKGTTRRAEVLNQPQQVLWVQPEYSGLGRTGLRICLLCPLLSYLDCWVIIWISWADLSEDHCGGFVAVTILPLLTCIRSPTCQCLWF